MSSYEEEEDESINDEEEDSIHYYYNYNQFEDDNEENTDTNDDIEATYDPEEESINTEAYQDLYDIYRIHTSNVEMFSILGSNMNLPSGINSYHLPEFMTCPICEDNIRAHEFRGHIINQHTSFYLSMNILLDPNMNLNSVQSVLNTINEYRQPNNNNTYSTLHNLIFNEDGDDEPSYEELLSLCDQIGYHKPGVQDIDSVASILCDRETINEDETCRICLEGLLLSDSIRKINKCNHAFCSECIETWFRENKTCPLCNIDVRENPRGSLEDVD